MTQKVRRQPYASPIAVPSGTPRMLARVTPATTSEMAVACRPGGARRVAKHDGDTEEQAVAAGDDQPGAEQHPVGRREPAQDIANDEDDHDSEQQRAARHGVRDQRQQRAGNRHARARSR